MCGCGAVVGGLERFFETVLPHLNEVQRRVVAAAMAGALGRGGQARVAAASGMSSSTVIKAEAEVRGGIEPSDRLRAPGGGDRPAIDKQPGLLEALDELVHPGHAGHADVAVAVDVEVDLRAGPGPARPGVPGVGRAGAAPVAPDGLLAAGPGQAERGHAASRP